jgi:hypothetical protein
MRCSRCHTENPVGMKFCGQCAAPLNITCTLCGADNSAESNFCSQCGARVGRQMNTLDSHSSDRSMRIPNPKTAGTCEMKQVTVLFCDIVNSTTLAERTAPSSVGTRKSPLG